MDGLNNTHYHGVRDIKMVDNISLNVGIQTDFRESEAQTESDLFLGPLDPVSHFVSVINTRRIEQNDKTLHLWCHKNENCDKSARTDAFDNGDHSETCLKGVEKRASRLTIEADEKIKRLEQSYARKLKQLEKFHSLRNAQNNILKDEIARSRQSFTSYVKSYDGNCDRIKNNNIDSYMGSSVPQLDDESTDNRLIALDNKALSSVLIQNGLVPTKIEILSPESTV